MDLEHYQFSAGLTVFCDFDVALLECQDMALPAMWEAFL
jgi:hypothetical protein